MKITANISLKGCILSCLLIMTLVIGGIDVLAQQENTATPISIAKTQDIKNSHPVSPSVDVVFVLDNSGSMIANDPKFITREVVTNYLKNLKETFRIGMVIFDREAKLIEPLSPIDTAEVAEHYLSSLEEINYKGQYTNTPAGIERAIYELKSNGRKDAEKIIILLTDGIVDTGNKAQDIAGVEWLREQLTLECKNAGIRIFGVAFTEMADFRLIQTLALKTDGEYFRTFNSADIPAVFDKINEIISTPETAQTQPETVAAETPPPAEPKVVPQAQPAPSPKPEKTVKVVYDPLPLLLSGLIIIVLVVVILIYLSRKKDIRTVKDFQKEGIALDNPPEDPAELIDAENVIAGSDLSLPIDKKLVKIGRDETNDIVIPEQSVSGLHATIEFRNGHYYLEDQRSTNGTWLNDMAINANTAMLLKSGDKIQFAVYEFRFLLPEVSPYGETVLIQTNTDPDLKL